MADIDLGKLEGAINSYKSFDCKLEGFQLLLDASRAYIAQQSAVTGEKRLAVLNDIQHVDYVDNICQNKFDVFIIPAEHIGIVRASLQSTPAVKKGWKLVPVEPIEEILNAVLCETTPYKERRPLDSVLYIRGIDQGVISDIYKPMISAAPEVE